jgi:two-component system CheB/CheR fusion protein
LPAAVRAGYNDQAMKKIVVVDDNLEMATGLALLLRAFGHVVQTAASGPAALALARDFIPDVVVLDIGLPGMDGHELARCLRRERGTAPDLLLVALTGREHESDRQASREAGIDHHLVKPIEPHDLLGLLSPSP